MKTMNHTFINHKYLDSFVLENKITESHTLLIQCFDGKLHKENTQELLHYLHSHLPHAIIIGASTDGEIIDGSSSNNSLILSFSTFDSSELISEVVSLEAGSFKAGEKLAQKALEFDAKAMILFTDALATNGDDLMEGVNSLKINTIVSGGMAGDNGAFKKTYVILGKQIYLNSLVCVFLKGPTLDAYNRSSFHWEAIGPKFVVTKSEQNKVYTLNNIPIVDIYREYLGNEVAKILPNVGVAFPLIMNVDGEVLGRAPLSLLENGGLGFGGTIKQGSEVQFGVGNLKHILESSKNILIDLLKNKVESIFIYSCTARKRYMGTNVNKEMTPLNTVAPTSGFFTYGEFYTQERAKTCAFLNETMTVLALSEKKGEFFANYVYNPMKSKENYADITLLALAHFINKTSSELQNFNNSLQERVTKEVALNREKDKLMLAQSRRATMGEMVSMIAHQWRQPLSAIGLAADNLSLDAALEDISEKKVTELSALITNQVQYLSKTINDFGTYFSPENNVESFSAQEFYDELMLMVAKECQQKNIELYSEFTSADVMITYKKEVLQICLNLFNNAKDILTQKQTGDSYIKFLHRFNKGYHEIYVSDNAGGIPLEIIDRLFEPYFSTKSEKNGTGLGLYMSKIIAQNYLKGDLTCSNTKDGAVFVLRFKNKIKDNI